MNIGKNFDLSNIDKEQAENIRKCLDALRDMCESRDNLNSQEFIIHHSQNEINEEHFKLLRATNDFINNAKKIKEEYVALTFSKCLSILQ